MFVGFNATLSDEQFQKKQTLNEEQGFFAQQKQHVRSQLDAYISADGSLSAGKMEEDWFPKIDADVFISHSHKDAELAKSFAAWLYDSFGIKAFIDSCVWGYANELLAQIDRKYCVLTKDESGKVKSYDYQKRNGSTAHVHMLLNTALQKMIDKTECLFFLNTPNSVNLDTISRGTETFSPWIYGELEFSRRVRHKKLSEYRRHLAHGDAVFAQEELKVNYQVSVDHLYPFDNNDCHSLCTRFPYRPIVPSKVLDYLYAQKNVFSNGE